MKSSITFISALPISTISHGQTRCSSFSHGGNQTLFGRLCSFRGERVVHRSVLQPMKEGARVRSTPCALFEGGGLLGVGTPEIVVILGVGWIFLGPQKLFELSKDAGKLIGELRRTANDAKSQFSDAMETDLLLKEMEAKSDGRKTSAEKNGVNAESEGKKDDELNVSFPNLLSADAESSAIASAEPLAESQPESQPVNSVFIDQLQRVADADQKPPGNLPDLEIDEEEELNRLEKQYFAAKERMEKRNVQKEEAAGQDEAKSVTGES